MKHGNCLAMIVLLLFSMAAMAEEYREPISLNFGIVPQQSASKLARIWGPVLDYLEARTGYHFSFKTAKNIPTFEQRLQAGEYDIAYMNPYHYTVYHGHPGYQAIGKARDKQIKGILVVRKESPYQQLAELEGSALAFPSPAAFAASILPRSELRQQGIAITPEYVSSHDSVYRNVAAGRFPAGGGVIRTFNAMDASVRDQLRVLWTSRGYTPHAIAVHPRIDEQTLLKVQQALVAMEQDPEGRKLLDDLKIKGWAAAVDGDWDDVRALNIGLLK